MWAKIAAGVAGAVVTAYVGRKAYVANRDRKQETADLKKKAEELAAQWAEIAQKTQELEEGATKFDTELKELDRKVVRLSAELKNLDARTSEGLKNIDTKLDSLVEMLKAKEPEPTVVVQVPAAGEVVETVEAPIDQVPEAIVSAEEMAELLVPRNAGKRNRKAA